jgi:sarcosine oxidase, subunit gamma
VTADPKSRRRSPLAGWTDRLGAIGVHSGGMIRLAEEAFLSQANVRAAGDTARAAAGVALGVTLPIEPNTTSRSGDRLALWLGPDEWLVLGTRQPIPPDDPAGEWSLVDVSAQRTTIAVAGPAALDLLAHGCALDLDGAAPGWCAQTLLARARVTLYVHGANELRILVHASFAPYVAAWLIDAATEWTTPHEVPEGPR